MWNMMMVEDEAIVRLGLKSMNVWQKHRVNWFVEASNGEEALEKGGLEHVHILMTDIRMPRIDGLELANRVKAYNNNIQVIFLSSYDDFDYVKKALQLGAVDYLHKPTMGEFDISQVLEKAIANLQSLKTADAQGEEYLGDKDRNYFLLTMIDRYTRPRNWADKWKQFALPAKWDAFVLVRMRITEQQTGGQEDPQTVDSLYYSVRHFVEEYLKKSCEVIVFTRGFREIIALIHPGEAGADAVRDGVNKLTKAVSEMLNVDMYFSFSRPHAEWADIPDAYLEALLDTPVNVNDYSPIIKKAYESIQQRFCEDLTLAGLAEELHISVSYLSRQLSKEVGENFVDLLTRMRMVHAKKLLRETSLKVYEVSDAVGYKNSHYFSRLFREVIGMTPGEYRSQKTYP